VLIVTMHSKRRLKWGPATLERNVIVIWAAWM